VQNLVRAVLRDTRLFCC